MIMEEDIRVEPEANDPGEFEPHAIYVDGERLEVLGIGDRWYDQEARYFKLRASDGNIYLLRCEADEHRWTLVKRWVQES